MDDWRSLLRKSVKDGQSAQDRLGVDAEEINRIHKSYAISITPHLLKYIGKAGDPIWEQFVPRVEEIQDTGPEDPLHEEEQSPVANLVHRYPDRALLQVTSLCAAYCRFCTRKRKVGDPAAVRGADVRRAVAYIADHPEIKDVILSGGDPLILTDHRLDVILRELRAIPSLEIIRIGTRIPVHLPQRITAQLCEILQKYHPFFINTHINHPDELTPETVKALGKLVDAGIPVGCQTVLLKGINDSVEVMMALMRGLLRARVRPYYIYQGDLTRGANHFRTRVEKGLEIIGALRGALSGLGIPQFIVDSPGGKGKIAVLPESIVSMNDEKVVLRNHAGELVTYPQPPSEEVGVASRVGGDGVAQRGRRSNRNRGRKG